MFRLKKSRYGKMGKNDQFTYGLKVTWTDGIHITLVSVTALNVRYLSSFLPDDKNGLICFLVNVTFLVKLKKKTGLKKTMQSASKGA